MKSYDERLCALGEGPLWHPERKELFWFDILGKRLLSRDGDQALEWQFDEHVSAAGWVDRDSLIMASETALWHFDIDSGTREQLCPLEADNSVTRSNDGRADPWGGFWIGTMGKQAEPQAGAIYRYYNRTLRKLVPDVSISNAICFAPDRTSAYYTDTVTQQIMRQPLSRDDGWPDGAPEVFADLKEARLNPDGAVTDAAGNLWCAMWGAACVVCFSPDGTELRRIDVPARQPTCPAFGGPELRDLLVTSATHGLRDSEIEKRPLNGATFVFEGLAEGLPEPRVIL
ncbi:SMP-30/gluconolactonase/LRE family protein [Marimonas sp. MJW-29]|uniref:SMP-30/gluconolactonase/LRE family protein n=1 Tax=Sulfitobacter sediminis TaxID=3234186 RepID=A0ABV3RHP8_9RHOB